MCGADVQREGSANRGFGVVGEWSAASRTSFDTIDGSQMGRHRVVSHRRGDYTIMRGFSLVPSEKPTPDPGRVSGVGQLHNWGNYAV